jgi:5-methylcytosine-specific restriction protein A
VRNGVCSVCGALRAQTAAEHDERRGSSRARGYDYRWEKVRRMHLANEPLCRMCGRLADLVDHIQPIRDGGERLDDANLQSLCRSCHDRKTGDDVRRRRAGVGGVAS